MNYSRWFCCFNLMVCLIALPSAAHAKMYRWVDKQGNVYYSDQVPPSQSKLERKVLSDTGRVIETIRAAKTQEEIDLEKRLAILRAEQEKIIAKQKSTDNISVPLSIEAVKPTSPQESS